MGEEWEEGGRTGGREEKGEGRAGETPAGGPAHARTPADVAELERLDGGPPEGRVRVPPGQARVGGHLRDPVGPGRVGHVAEQQVGAEEGGAALLHEATAQRLDPLLRAP